MEKDKGENIRQKLDEEFSSLRELLYAVPITTDIDDTLLEQDTTAQPAAFDPSKDSVPKASEDEPLLAFQDQDYDQHVRELAFDKRSKPKDRTKSEEELVLEQKEALEKAERKRQRRMLGLDESESEGEGTSGKKRKRGGDDLEDDFVTDGDARSSLGTGLGPEARQSSDDDISGEEKSGEEENGEESGEEESGDEDKEESEDEAGGEGEQEELVTTSKNKKQISTSNQELPYTFSCPETHDDFLEIVEKVSDSDVPIVVQRIRTLHHTSLAPENKFKLQVCHVHPIAGIIDLFS
jgi:nucleolar protein 14